MLIEFNTRWGQKIYQKRQAMGLALDEVSLSVRLQEKTVGRAESEPGRVPLCELYRLLRFYGVTMEERFELGMLSCNQPHRSYSDHQS